MRAEILSTGYVFKHRVDDPGYMDVSTSSLVNFSCLRINLCSIIFFLTEKQLGLVACYVNFVQLL